MADYFLTKGWRQIIGRELRDFPVLLTRGVCDCVRELRQPIPITDEKRRVTLGHPITNDDDDDDELIPIGLGSLCLSP